MVGCATERVRSTTAADLRVAAAVLAAGGSTRLGQPKQLARYQGNTLLARAVSAAVAAGCKPVLAIIGADAPRMRKELHGLAVEVVENAEWREGMSTSIRAALDALAEREVDALLFLTCDQPHVTAGLLRTLVDTMRSSSGCHAVACSYAGGVGVPALFRRELHGELRALVGDRGARAVLERHRDRVAEVPFPLGAVDVDSAEDLDTLE